MTKILYLSDMNKELKASYNIAITTLANLAIGLEKDGRKKHVEIKYMISDLVCALYELEKEDIDDKG